MTLTLWTTQIVPLLALLSYIIATFTIVFRHNLMICFCIPLR